MPPISSGAALPRLTIVCAPSGYGKTTLVAQSLGAELGSTAWFSIGESDNDLGRFLAYFGGALARACPDLAPFAQSLRVDFADGPAERMLDELLTAIDVADRQAASEHDLRKARGQQPYAGRQSRSEPWSPLGQSRTTIPVSAPIASPENVMPATPEQLSIEKCGTLHALRS